ncbi:MAG TPA: serine/threonine-protein kinase [Candidatus Acidoferrum sp.]|nr:serine/threonine-protein kinase [Candidatus Acidoferrum sp.]
MIKTSPQEEALFDAARNLTSAAARRAFLDQACADNPGLRAQVEALLATEGEAERFFSDAAAQVVLKAGALKETTAKLAAPGAEPERDLTDISGTRIGRYKLLQRIGEGGAGTVYMAEQEEPVRRRVALKIIKLGMDTKSVIARFEAERQALAMMDHPNIARVLDAGATDTGRPYFVMELVRGIKITDYCDKNQLDTRRRLDLFIPVCQAIQHAHQKGIIHRDIKPSNILVTLHDGVPVPKVIDFGIAKATEAQLTDKTLFTAYEQIIGTPAYMSPEQAEMSGLDIDTRTDIYSLGVLLYELLTGRPPFDPRKLMQHGLDEMRRTLREEEPQRPSTMVTTLQRTELTATAEHRHAEPPKLISLLRGDLDWIVMKALEKDRRRRYETANGLAMDIQRYLSNEPVVARPPSRLYRFQKLVRRNRVIFGAAAAVLLALVIGLGSATWAFLKEKAAHARAVAAEQQQARLRVEAEQAEAREAELRRQAETREKITQASWLVSQDRFNEADALFQGILPNQPTVEGAAVVRALGEWHAREDRWRPAADRFNQLLQIDRLDGWDIVTLDYLEYGPVLIELGDLAGYEHFRQDIVARGGEAVYPFTDRIIKISLLLPADKTIMAALNPLAQIAEKSFATNLVANGDVFLAAWRSVSLALMEYRRGEYAKAAAWCHRCLDYPEYNAPRAATARVILAMACQRLGQGNEARSELNQARGAIENKFKTGLDRGTGVQGFWFDWLFARILLREATPLIEGAAGRAR